MKKKTAPSTITNIIVTTTVIIVIAITRLIELNTSVVWPEIENEKNISRDEWKVKFPYTLATAVYTGSSSRLNTGVCAYHRLL